MGSPEALGTWMRADHAEHQKVILRDEMSVEVRQRGVKQTDS
jgi:hypothetical protein